MPLEAPVTTATRPWSGLAVVCVDMVVHLPNEEWVCCRTGPAHLQSTRPVPRSGGHGWPCSGWY